jgi:phage terminase large subunit
MRRFMFGADWGFSNDPSVLTRCWVDDGGPGKKRLMVDYEAFGYHVESDDLQFLFAGGTANKTGIEYPGIPGSRENPIKADGARPETISFMRRQGFNIAAARKWKGSVEDGITYLKTYDQIVIHPRCVNFAQEARLYSYEIEAQTSKILRSVRDMHNHGWDSIRYGHDGLIVAKGSLGAWQRIADKGRAL